jgi:two-component sensor histidine kinase/CheY-like chemotaxis protein
VKDADQTTILIVEDEALIRMISADILSEAGFRVLESENAAEAVAIMEGAEQIELLFTDIRMPGRMDGLELANFVHARGLVSVCSSLRLTVSSTTAKSPMADTFSASPTGWLTSCPRSARSYRSLQRRLLHSGGAFWISEVAGALALCDSDQEMSKGLAARRQRYEGQHMVSDQSADTPRWDVTDLRYAIEAAGVALWSWDVESDRLTMDERGFDLWGLGPQAEITFEDLSLKIHPADRDRVRAAFSATRAVVGAYEIDFRILVDNEVRWISARGQGDDAGIVGVVMFGIFLDVTGRKQAEEAHELLAGEMSHRVKNLLAIASSLTTITSRSAASAAAMAQDLTGRLSALGRAHDLVRPTIGNPGNAALVGDLITVLLAPYDDLAAPQGRVRVSVPRIAVGESAATNLALILHELATNSVKYGALSIATGTLDVTCTVRENDVALVWTERGGPPVEEPAQTGFGSKLITRIASRLGGSFGCDWSTGGVIISVDMKMNRLAG